MRLARAVLAILTVLGLLLVAHPVHSQDGVYPVGIGLSGSLTAVSPLEVPQGGRVESADIFIVVYNYLDHPLRVKLGYEAPPGIRVFFKPNNTITVTPELGVRVEVGIEVAGNVTPGDYEVYVKAEPVIENTLGPVRVVPGAAMKLVVRVVGQHARLHVEVRDPAGSIVSNALTRVYRMVGGKERSVLDSWGGVLDAVLVPGQYTVRVYLAGEEAASKQVALGPGDNVSLTLTAKILYVENFVVRPIKRDGRIVGARIIIVIKNIYRTINDASIVLRVAHNSKLLEERPISQASILPKGRTEYRLDYIPERLEPGNYTFQVVVRGLGGRMLAASQPVILSVEASHSLLAVVAALLLAALLVAAVLQLKKRLRGGAGKKLRVKA